MMWQEFEEIAGYEVSFEDYNNIIEPMYMATNMSKQEFVKCIDKKRFALKTKGQLISGMRKEAKHQMEICGHWTDYDSADKLDNLISEYMKRFFNGLDWFINKEYEYPGYRGCSFPKELVICGKHGNVYDRVQLVK